MWLLRRVLDRILPALITAAGVTLLAAGLLSYTAPPTAGDPTSATPTLVAASPTVSPTATPVGSGSFTPPALTPSASPTAAGPVVATRVVVQLLKIDLPILPSDYEVSGNGSYPLCDVAQYLLDDAYRIAQPGIPGRTSYIYGHAREGMF